MEVKEFERFLELKDRHYENLKRYPNFTQDDEMIEQEYSDLKKRLENILFDNQTNAEKIITKLKSSLYNYRYNLRNNNPSETLNEVKVIREIMDLINRYDWKLMYSEYTIDDKKQIAIWEQNGEGQIRNHKTWDIK